MKKTKIKLWTGSIWEEVFPETDARLVHLDHKSGDNLDSWATRVDLNLTELFDKHTAQDDTIQEVKDLAEEAKDLALGSAASKVFSNYAAMCFDLQNNPAYTSSSLKVGTHLLIIQLNVPDLWVSHVLPDEYAKVYDYTDDAAFLEALNTDGHVIIGKYWVSALETQKVNLPDYVKFTDWATDEKGGVLRGVRAFGFYVDTYGRGTIVKAENSDIDAKTNEYKPIVPKTQDHAWKVSATTNTETWTDEEKAAACETIGAVKQVTEGGLLKVYGTAGNGSQVTYNLISGASNVADGRIPRYRTNTANEIMPNDNCVLPTGTPLLDHHATNKAYVDNNFVAKTTGALILYGTDSNGNQTTWVLRNTNNTKNTIAGRDSNGNIQVGTAVNPTDAINKQFAEGNFVIKSTVVTTNKRVYIKNADGTNTLVDTGSYALGRDTIPMREVNGCVSVGTPSSDNHATTKNYVDNLFVQARFNFTSGSNYLLINIYMKKSDYDTINSIETLAAYVNGKGATTNATAMILHMGEKGTDTAVTDILQYIVAQNATSFTIIGYARASGAGTFINSSTLTYTSKAYVRL